MMLTATGRAALKWDHIELERTLEVGELKVVLPFTFTNEGDHPVAIIEVSTSCGCVAATAPAERVYKTGEKGQVKAVFTVGRLSGEQTKSIYVTTSDSPEKPTVLTVKVNVLKAATLSEASVRWKKGEPAEEKVVKIAAQTTTIIALDPLTPDQAALVSARIEPDEEAVGYVLKVRPLNTNRPLQFPLRMHAVVGKAKQAPMVLFVRVE